MKNSKKLLITILIMLMLTPCYIYAEPENTESPIKPSETENPPVSPSPSPSPSEKPEIPSEKSIHFDEKEIILDSGKTETLKVTVTPEDAEIEWSSSNDKIATIENGKVTAGTTAGEVTITATIKGTNIKDTCTVKVRRTIGKDASLKKLVISNGKLDKAFDSNTFDYTVTIEPDVTKLSIQYELSDDNASYFGPDNNKNLKNGDKLKLKIVAEDGNTDRTYTLTIVKDAASLELKSLKINGYALNETFQPDLLEYTASIPYEVDTITVVANAKDNAATLKIDGLTNLKVGTNTVTIIVSDKAGNNKKYTILFTREEKSSIEEKPTSIITSSDHSSTTSNNNNSAMIPKANNDDGFLKYAIVSFACLILFIIGGIGIYFYLKTSPKRLKKELINSKRKEQATSPIVEVEHEEISISPVTATENDMESTKEYNIKKEEKIPTLDELFDDNKDV